MTNGLGGYASGTICGVATRRYHGLLIAAHPVPLGRVMMVNHLWEFLRLPDYRTVPFGGEEKVGAELHIHGAEHLVEFRLDAGLPVWRYEVEGFQLERRIYFAYRHNTVYIRYRLTGGSGRVRLKLKPSVHFRGHDEPVNTDPCIPTTLSRATTATNWPARSIAHTADGSRWRHSPRGSRLGANESPT